MYIGVDLGGTNIGIGVVDSNNTLIFKDSIPTRRQRNYNDIIENIVDLINKTIIYNGLSKNDIKGIGIGIPGIVKPGSGVVINCINLKWKNVPMKEIIEENIKLPVYIGNDATVAGVAEFEVGAMKGYNTGVLITLGTGVGSGIIINEKIYEGFNGAGSEIGHMIVGENFYSCNCGRNGCLETFCSSTAIINYTVKLIDQGNDTSIMANVNGDKSKIDGHSIFNAAKQGDVLACKVIDRMVKYLAIGIMNVISVIDPQVIVIGGGLSAAGEFLISKIKKEVSAITYYKDVNIPQIILSQIGNDGGIIGAATLCKHF